MPPPFRLKAMCRFLPCFDRKLQGFHLDQFPQGLKCLPHEIDLIALTQIKAPFEEEGRITAVFIECFYDSKGANITSLFRCDTHNVVGNIFKQGSYRGDPLERMTNLYTSQIVRPDSLTIFNRPTTLPILPDTHLELAVSFGATLNMKSGAIHGMGSVSVRNVKIEKGGVNYHEIAGLYAMRCSIVGYEVELYQQD